MKTMATKRWKCLHQRKSELIEGKGHGHGALKCLCYFTSCVSERHRVIVHECLKKINHEPCMMVTQLADPFLPSAGIFLILALVCVWLLHFPPCSLLVAWKGSGGWPNALGP